MKTINLVSDLFETATRHPDATALVQGREQMSYAELIQKAVNVSSILKPAICNGRVGILGSRSLAAYVGIVAACHAGATYVPLNLKWPEARLIELLNELELDALVLDKIGTAKLTDAVRAAAPNLLIVSDDTTLMAGTVRFEDMPNAVVTEPVKRNLSDLGYIVFTSGSTGTPKGVMVSCGSLFEYVEQTQKWADLNESDRIAEAHDVTFDLSIHNMFLAWQRGAALYLMSSLDLLAPHSFIRKHDISVWMSVPTIVNTMRRSDILQDDMFPTLRLSIFCGEPLAMSTVLDWAKAAPNSAVDNIYGPTECTVVCTRQRLRETPVVTIDRQILAIGKPYENFVISIRDPEGRVLDDGETGEIVIASSQLSNGYFNRPEQTAQSFRVIDGVRWYFTGDLGYRDANGVFHHMGRTDNQIKLKGNRIELEEVEAHFRKACETDLTCVVAWPIIEGSVQGLVGFVAGANLDRASIQSMMKETLPDYMVPDRIEMLDELPVNINGKIDRGALKTLLDSPMSSEPIDGQNGVSAPTLVPDLTETIAVKESV